MKFWNRGDTVVAIDSISICWTRWKNGFYTTVLLSALLAFATNGLAFAQALPGQIDQFAGSTCKIFTADKISPDAATVVWRLMTANRTLGQGSSRWKQNDLGLEFTFTTPAVNAGVILEAELHYRIGTVLPEQQITLRLRDGDPLAAIQQTLAAAGVALWDPIGITDKAFETLSFRPKRVSSLRDVGDERIVIIGEANAWDKQNITELERFARKGKWVIVMRGAEGALWPVSLSARDSPELAFTQLSRGPWWPAKLDTDFWAIGTPQAQGWSLHVRDHDLVLTPSSGVDVWQLVKHSAPHDNGGICFIGVPMLPHWEVSPVPRELLAHLFIQIILSAPPN